MGKDFKYYPPLPERVVGYCKYHKWRMSKVQIYAKGCMYKDNSEYKCRHFQVHFDNEYWSSNAGKGLLEKINLRGKR